MNKIVTTKAFENVAKRMFAKNLGRHRDSISSELLERTQDKKGLEEHLTKQRADRFMEFVSKKMDTLELTQTFEDLQDGVQSYETNVYIISPNELQDIFVTFGEELLNELGVEFDEKRGTEKGIQQFSENSTRQDNNR